MMTFKEIFEKYDLLESYSSYTEEYFTSKTMDDIRFSIDMFVTNAFLKLSLLKDIEELRESMNISSIGSISSMEQLILNSLDFEKPLTKNKLFKIVKDKIDQDENAGPFSVTEADKNVQTLVERGMVSEISKGKRKKYLLLENQKLSEEKERSLQEDDLDDKIINEISLESNQMEITVNNDDRIFNVEIINGLSSPLRAVSSNQIVDKLVSILCKSI